MPQPAEDGLLADDLRFFRALAKDAPDPRIRSGAARLASYIEFFERPDCPFRKIFEHFKFAEKIQQLSDPEIGRYLSLTARDDESELRKLLRASALPWVLLAMLPRDHPERRDVPRGFEMALTFLCVFYRAAIRREYSARRAKNEDVNGRAMREILVEEGKRGELIMQLGQRMTRRLFFPGETRWRSEEVPAEAYVGLWQTLGPYTKTNPVAADPNCLCAFMDGSLNPIPEEVRLHMRSRAKTEKRHLKTVVAERDTLRVDESDESQHRVLAEMTRDRSAADVGFAKILFEQFVSELKADDQKILELCNIQGYSQKETAAILGVTQGLVSKRLSFIRESWKKVVQSPPAL